MYPQGRNLKTGNKGKRLIVVEYALLCLYKNKSDKTTQYLKDSYECINFMF